MKKIWGLLLAAGIAALAKILSTYVPGPGDICWAILLGIIAGNLMRCQKRVEPGLGFAEETLLPVAIALMGSELELHALGRLGAYALLVVLVPMVLSILASLLLGRWLKLSSRSALVLGIGNSVCGSSAVLASAPALKAETHDVAVAVAAVNLMGTVGMFLLPPLAAWLTFSDTKTSYLIGGSLQAVGQVLASGFSVSDGVGYNALIIKMLRVVMIGPIVVILHHLFKGTEDAEPEQKRKVIPGYIMGFMICAVAASFFHEDTVVLPHIKSMAKLLLVVAMAAIGCRIRIRSLLAHGSKAILMVFILSLIQTGSILLLLRVVHF